MRKTARIVLWALLLGLFISGMAFAQGKKKFEIVMVVKLEGVSWFDDMRRGIERFAKDYASEVNAYQIGHNTGDPAAQIRLVEDLIAKKVDAIIVIPNDVKAMEPVLKKANDAGILTFSHEAASLQNVSYDIEAFNNAAFGEEMMKNLGKNMGGQGEYAQIVGLLTMETHMDWATAASNYQKKNFPKMKLVTVPPVEDSNDQQLAYQKALELLKKYPNLKGFQGNTAGSAPAFALAVEDKGLQGKFKISGLSLPSMAKDYLKRGTIQSIHFWSPADAGYVSARVALEVLKKNPIKSGMNLGRPGYDKVKVVGKVIFGNAPITCTAENVDNYNF